MNSITAKSPRSMQRIAYVLSTLALLAVCVPGSASTEVSWSLHENCPSLNTGSEISCGSYGSFYVGATGPAGCPLVEEGSEVPPRYYPNTNVQNFPTDPVPVESRSRVSQALGQLTMRSAQTAMDDQPPAAVFVGVVDFSGSHGDSVEWLTKRIAGNVSTRKFVLDSNESVVAEGVSDLEVLAQLCGVSQHLERLGQEYQSVVNMSFGRALRDDDPTGAVGCQEDRLSCQIRNVLEHLRDKGAVLVAAAGKQRETMFPAAIDSVIAAGMINPAEFMQKGTTRPTWEMPDDLDALMPGSSLCIRNGWTAPAGASYSSAILSGWLAQSMAENAPLAFDQSGRWKPFYSADRQCVVLTKNGNEYTGCNAAIEEMFLGLEGGYMNDCWSNGSGVTVQANLKATPNSQPIFTAAIQWDPLVRPSPEGDPCVPCTGGSALRVTAANKAPSGSFNINLSQTHAFLDGVVVDAVHLRLDESFYKVDLNDEQLSLLTDGEVGQLTLNEAADSVENADSASLFFSLRDENVLDCADVPGQPPACVWMSTHIHVP